MITKILVKRLNGIPALLNDAGSPTTNVEVQPQMASILLNSAQLQDFWANFEAVMCDGDDSQFE